MLYSASQNKVADMNAMSIVCHECDNHVLLPTLQHKQAAICPRCGLQLTVFHDNAAQKIIALASTALIFLIASLPFEFLTFNARGQEHSINMFASLMTLVENGYALLALVELIAVVLLPAIVLLSLLYLLVPLSFGIQPAKSTWVIKTVFKLLPWTMAEIFLIGVLVSLIKIVSMAEVGIGISFYAYMLFTVVMIITLLYVDKYQLRLLLNKEQPKQRPIEPSKNIQTTWALLLTSVLLYIPANMLPIMHTTVLGTNEPSTILGGVILLWKTGSYPIAIVIFVASLFVPVAKIIILSWLNYSVQAKHQHSYVERMFWYRVTEFIGRWSMIDVFVVAILVSLIQLGNIMNILPGHAALAFCGVVICTMLAAMSFDSRLIWQQPETQNSGDKAV